MSNTDTCRYLTIFMSVKKNCQIPTRVGIWFEKNHWKMRKMPSIWNDFWTHFSIIFQIFLNHFSTILESIFNSFWGIFWEQFWNHFAHVFKWYSNDSIIRIIRYRTDIKSYSENGHFHWGKRKILKVHFH